MVVDTEHTQHVCRLWPGSTPQKTTEHTEPMKTPPEPGSREWVRNERIINSNKTLRDARDVSEGFKPSSGIKTPAPTKAYRDGWERIFGKKNAE
jgi:hypothetical protein